jgi:hypothetical protein
LLLYLLWPFFASPLVILNNCHTDYCIIPYNILKEGRGDSIK